MSLSPGHSSTLFYPFGVDYCGQRAIIGGIRIDALFQAKVKIRSPWMAPLGTVTKPSIRIFPTMAVNRRTPAVEWQQPGNSTCRRCFWIYTDIRSFLFSSRLVLSKSNSCDEFGVPEAYMTTALLVAWIIVCAAIIRGVQSSGKVRIDFFRPFLHSNIRLPMSLLFYLTLSH